MISGKRIHSCETEAEPLLNKDGHSESSQARYAEWYALAKQITANAIHNELIGCVHRGLGNTCEDLAVEVLAALGEADMLNSKRKI